MILNINFGVISDSLSFQLKQQKLKFKATDIKPMQKDLEAIHRLKMRNILSQAECKKGCDRLYGALWVYLVKLNN